MAIKIGINGFGRIGRLVFRAAMEQPDKYEVVAINDPAINRDYMVYMTKYDTIHGRFNGTVEIKDEKFTVNGKAIEVFDLMNPAEIPWGQVGADYIVESTGVFTTTEKCQAHLQGGAKKVIISAPAKDTETPTFVMGVNQNTYRKEMTVVSNASCTTNCLAPMAKALNDCHPIISGLMCTIHGYTGDQMTLDGPQRKGDLRRSRAAAVNIVPNSTGAAKAIGLVIPELKGKLIGAAQRVPTPTGSTTLLHAVIEGQTSVDELNAAIKSQTNESFGYNTDEIVSSDIVGMRYGSLFDATQTMVMNLEHHMAHVQVVSWYDNENSYTSQMVRTIAYLAQL